VLGWKSEREEANEKRRGNRIGASLSRYVFRRRLRLLGVVLEISRTPNTRRKNKTERDPLLLGTSKPQGTRTSFGHPVTFCAGGVSRCASMPYQLREISYGEEHDSSVRDVRVRECEMTRVRSKSHRKCQAIPKGVVERVLNKNPLAGQDLQATLPASVPFLPISYRLFASLRKVGGRQSCSESRPERWPRNRYHPGTLSRLPHVPVRDIQHSILLSWRNMSLNHPSYHRWMFFFCMAHEYLHIGRGEPSLPSTGAPSTGK
jgi:hypothetical protein